MNDLTQENVFLNKLNSIIQELKNTYEQNNNESYEFLIYNLSRIHSISNFIKESNRILHFLADSYNGNPKVVEELEKLLLNYREKR